MMLSIRLLDLVKAMTVLGEGIFGVTCFLVRTFGPKVTLVLGRERLYSIVFLK
jgi:hypothetical protein